MSDFEVHPIGTASRIKRMEDELRFLDTVIDNNIIHTDNPVNRVQWKGEWLEGAAADCLIHHLRLIQKVVKFALEENR